MGKHDMRTATSSEEHLMNRIKELEKKLIFANDTIKKLQEQCSRMSKWASEIEANAEDKITKLEAENAKLRGKILKLVDDYVGRE
jgi:predicted  nucleic acid-binding Zn-ribbon protein